MSGVQVNVHQVLPKVLDNALVAVVPVQDTGILYGIWYSQVCVVDNLIFEQP